MIQPPNLRELLGDRYRVIREESFAADRGENARAVDPWLLIIPCQAGHLYPHGQDTLAASTNSRGRTAKRLAALPFARMLQDGDDGINVAFPVSDFPTVAALMKPRRRRQLSPEQIADRTERLRKYQFPPASQNDSGDRTSVPSPQDAPRAA